MKFLFDFFPVLLFFLTYKFYGDLPPDLILSLNHFPLLENDPANPKDAIFLATFVIIIATVIQNAINYILYKKLEKMHLISLGLVVFLGGLTILFKETGFIIWKVTIVNWLFALVFLGSQFIGKKTLVERMMSHAIQVSRDIWIRLNMMWSGFFIFVGIVNLYVAYNFTEEIWVDFKLFGILGITIVFIIIQAIYLSRHASQAEAITEK